MFEAYIPLQNVREIEIGSYASGPFDIADVEPDVSRHHAKIYQRDGRWFIVGLRSTNGTSVILGKDKVEHVIEPCERERPDDFACEPCEICAMDTICLGSSTQFLAIPVLGE